MDSKPYKRIGTVVAMVVSLFVFPWWVTCMLGIYFVLFFNKPFEIFIIALFLDGMYGIVQPNFFFTHIFFLGAVVVFIVSLWIKEHFMFKN